MNLDGGPKIHQGKSYTDFLVSGNKSEEEIWKTYLESELKRETSTSLRRSIKPKSNTRECNILPWNL